ELEVHAEQPEAPPARCHVFIRRRLLRKRHWHEEACRRRRDDPGATPPAVDEEARAGAAEGDGVAGGEAAIADEGAPPFRDDVALAAAPVGEAERPRLPAAAAVLEPQHGSGAGRPRRAAGNPREEVPLREVLGHHQPVQLAHVARCHHLVEHVLPHDHPRLAAAISIATIAAAAVPILLRSPSPQRGRQRH
uniref:Uncharacterized protein n=1 Tax=Triticum urartu TaxID=4572 RepID=A0A8R7V7E9_TRIUA